MSKPKRDTRGRSKAVPDGAASSQLERGDERNRIDPPHKMASPQTLTPVEPPAEVTSDTPVQPEQVKVPDEAAQARVHAQADQLAAHLRSRQKELDHRESQVNACLAALDRDMRTARLWLKEREAEFTERAAFLDSREANLEGRERELARRARDMARAEAERSDAEKCARRKEIELAECRAEEARAEAESLRERLRQAHQELSEDARQQRRRLADEQRAALAEIEKQREAVRRRGEHVDKAHAALEQLRGELGRMHRETLEIRLATEELWVQLSGAAPPAALTKSLSGIRSKLADHYRLANAELQQQKQELEAIRRQLAEQYDKVLRQKQQYDHWAQQHRQDTEADASRLAARETELHQLQAELNNRALKWQAQRLDYEQQIRRLKAESEAVTA